MSNNQGGLTFVLVAGSGHGGWAWRRLADLLRSKDHRVYTPTLTGLGERSHLMSGAISLQTHILDVVNLFRWEDINGAVLVGHSYAGWVISGAIEGRVPRRGVGAVLLSSVCCAVSLPMLAC